MEIKYCEPFIIQKEKIEYIESLCNESRVKAELKRVGRSLRLATIELEKGLK